MYAMSLKVHPFSFHGSSSGKESACKAGGPGLISGSGKSPGEGIDYPLQYSWAFPGGLDCKESIRSAGVLGSVTGFGRSPGEGNSLLTPVFLPGELHGQSSLAGCRPWGCKESDTTE